MTKIIVTRHQNLVRYLLETGVIDGTETVLSHASAADVADKDVIGVLPLSLAALANSVTEIPLSLSPEDRGKELSVERLREIASDPVTYRVEEVKSSAQTAEDWEWTERGLS